MSDVVSAFMHKLYCTKFRYQMLYKMLLLLCDQTKVLGYVKQSLPSKLNLLLDPEVYVYPYCRKRMDNKFNRTL